MYEIFSVITSLGCLKGDRVTVGSVALPVVYVDIECVLCVGFEAWHQGRAYVAGE